MSIVMVKKILADGSPCAKCAQAEGILKKRGLWNRIDHVAAAVEGNAASEGMKLAAEYQVDLAPFFIVDTGAEKRLYTKVFEFIRNEFKDADAGSPTSAETPPIFEISGAKKRYLTLEPWEILEEAQVIFGKDFAIAFSGAEDVVLIDMAVKNKLPFKVFCLDTGRLHSETYDFLDQVRERYGITVEVFMPSPLLLEPFIREKGMNSFYRDGHGECCAIRKVEPLNRALAGRLAWAAGLRRDQSPATRSGMAHAEADPDHTNEAGGPLLKFNPLLDWTSDRVWTYIRENGVPYNRLHDMGYKSIGCAPCTRTARPGEHERMARWWWEDSTLRECGLHPTPPS